MLPLALQDIRETFVFLKAQSGPDFSARFLDAVQSTAKLLTDFPRMGSPCHYARPELKDLRRKTVKGFQRWQIFNFPRRDAIDVARVLHSARDLDAIFDPVTISSESVKG